MINFIHLGHAQPKIVEAIQKQAAKLDFAASFNSSHKLPYIFSEKLLELLPNKGFSEVFFTMCGSTAVGILTLVYTQSYLFVVNMFL